MWESDHKKGWAPKNWCFGTVVLEKTLESPFDCKESKPVHPKGNPHWIFIGRTDAGAEASLLWPPDVKNWFTGKDSDAGKGDDRGRDGWMESLTQWTWVWASSGRWWRTGEAWHAAVRGVARGQTQLSDWTTTTMMEMILEAEQGDVCKEGA